MHPQMLEAYTHTHTPVTLRVAKKFRDDVIPSPECDPYDPCLPEYVSAA